MTVASVRFLLARCLTHISVFCVIIESRKSGVKNGDGKTGERKGKNKGILNMEGDGLTEGTKETNRLGHQNEEAQGFDERN